MDKISVLLEHRIHGRADGRQVNSWFPTQSDPRKIFSGGFENCDSDCIRSKLFSCGLRIIVHPGVRMSSICPFAKTARPQEGCPVNQEVHQTRNNERTDSQKECPVKKHDEHCAGNSEKSNGGRNDSSKVPAKCPFGYDSHTFKLGPLSCIICQALLFQSSKCVPCSHKYCKACISRFKDCPICGADIDGIEPDEDLQTVVDRFIEGHCRIRRTHANKVSNDGVNEQKDVLYEDVSLERGAFMVQQAMRAFRAQNFESAKSRLGFCAEDIRSQIDRQGSSSELCSQLGAVLGMLGDCCRAMGDSESAVTSYEESVEFLSKLTARDLEVVHTLSVSLNKIGDLKYYEGNLQSARTYYCRSLEFRRNSLKDRSRMPSQVLDVATSLAKVADVDRSLGDENAAVNGFQEAIKFLESLKLSPSEASLEIKRQSVLDFLHKQLEDKQSPASASV